MAGSFQKSSCSVRPQELGPASTQILPTCVKPLDENTKAVIEALDAARISYVNRHRSVQ